MKTIQEKVLSMISEMAKKFSFEVVSSFCFPNVVNLYFSEMGIPNDILVAFKARLNFQPEYLNYSFQPATSGDIPDIKMKQAEYLKDMSNFFVSLENELKKFSAEMADYREFQKLCE